MLSQGMSFVLPRDWYVSTHISTQKKSSNFKWRYLEKGTGEDLQKIVKSTPLLSLQTHANPIRCATLLLFKHLPNQYFGHATATIAEFSKKSVQIGSLSRNVKVIVPHTHVCRGMSYIRHGCPLQKTEMDRVVLFKVYLVKRFNGPIGFCYLDLWAGPSFFPTRILSRLTFRIKLATC